MATITVEFKHKSQVGSGIITGINTIKTEITGGTLEYWNRYKDQPARELLAKRILEFEYGAKASEFIITKSEIK